MVWGGGNKALENTPQIIIVDASVVIKWFNIEKNTDKAVLLKEKFLKQKILLCAPSLLFYEVANALRYNPEFGELDVKKAIENLEDIQLKIFNYEKWFSQAIKIAFQYGITIYDSSYIGLGFSLNAPIITADEKLVKKVAISSLNSLSDNDFC